MLRSPFRRVRTISASTSSQQLDGAVDRRGDRRRQADALVDVGRLAADDDDAADLAAEAGQHAEHDAGVHRVRVDHGRAVVAGSGAATGRARTRRPCPAARPSAARRQDERVVAVEQLVGEVDAADAEVGDPHAVGHRPLASRLATSTPKPSSPRKMLPMPATSVLVIGRLAERLDLVGVEVEVPALPVELLGRRVVVER